MARKTSYNEDEDLGKFVKEHSRIEISADAGKFESLSVNIDAGDVLEYIGAEFMPDDVFTNEVLEEWAQENGYVKEAE